MGPGCAPVASTAVIPGVQHYDQFGEPISWQQYIELKRVADAELTPESWWRKLTGQDGWEISTAWVGIIPDSRRDPDGRPLIWETMISVDGRPSVFCFYATRAEACDDHERLAGLLRAGVDVSELLPR